MSASEPKEDVVRVRVTSEEKQQLRDLAHQRGLSMSELLRSAAAQSALTPTTER
jgi:hypothetical protein